MIGITENGDPTLDLSWINKTDNLSMVVLTTKNPGALINSTLSPIIKAIKDKLVIECCITGYGKTPFEPNVSSVSVTIMMINSLINKGYNVVIKIDPIIPTIQGLEKVKNVIDLLLINSLLNKVSFKYGFIQEYPHFTNRFISISNDQISEEDVHKYFKHLEDNFGIILNTLKYDNVVELLETPEQCYFRCSYCYHEKNYDLTQDTEQIGLI